jgi:dTMP kinase
MAARGKFITLEGGEGAGKSTQARILKAALEARGRRVVLTREPGGSPGAEQIRALLVSGDPQRWTALAETLLFLAARADHLARLIEPSLAEGAWVISDRFSDSTFVYQGIARGLGVEKVRSLHEAAFGDLKPDLTVILDLPAEEGLRRAQGRGEGAETRFEKFDSRFHERLRGAFAELAARENSRCVLIDAGKDQDTVAASVWACLEERLHP